LKLHLKNGGAALEVNGKTAHKAILREYEDIYAKFARLLKSGKGDVDPSPLQLVSDCFMLGKPMVVEPVS
jgi:D-galactose 1-dehydrogenase